MIIVTDPCSLLHEYETYPWQLSWFGSDVNVNSGKTEV